ncbi:hypothetical protein HDV06_005734 [Boothiomyces sp. JEL0866]|nr:hypothetical protein HDV06_005734 [Boothiomyces sp. JEL0866]
MTLIINSDGNTAKITSSNGKKLKISSRVVHAPKVNSNPPKHVPPKVSVGSKPCFICNQDQWKHEFEASTSDSELDPLHVFYQTIVEDYQITCQTCESKTVLGLIGYTGAGIFKLNLGKSTLLNILANRKIVVFEDSMGNLSLDVPDPIQGSEVSDGMASMTSLPNYYVQDFILCDFPGFGDNRGGQMQLLQYLIMQHVIANRPHKFILVKSVLTKRDQGFIDLANLDFISAENTIGVVSHASVKAPKTIDRYTDFQVSKPIRVVPLLAPYFHSETLEIVAHDYHRWSLQFIQQLDRLSSFEGNIDIPHTGEIFRYISLWKSRLVKDIQQVIDATLNKILPAIPIEPHNIDFLLSIWDQKVSLGQCLANLQSARILLEIPTELTKMERSWNLFNRFSPEESDCGSINNKWSSESAEIILAFRSRVEIARTLPTYDFLNLEAYMTEWNKFLHSHLLAYSPVKVKAMALMRGNSQCDRDELLRLCNWRLLRISEATKHYSKVLKLSKLTVKNEEVFSDEADKESRYLALGLLDEFFTSERQLWTKFSFDKYMEFENNLELITNRILSAIGTLEQLVKRKDISELVAVNKENFGTLLQALLARSTAPAGTHFWEHDLRVEKVYTTDRIFDCCNSTLFDDNTVLHCLHCSQYCHKRCSPAFYAKPCKTANEFFNNVTEDVSFAFTIDSAPQLSKDTLRYKIAGLTQEILETPLKYKTTFEGNTAYVVINDTRNIPNVFSNFFMDAIRINKESKDTVGLLCGFHSKAIELYNLIWEEIPRHISSIYFSGRGIGGSIAHCLNLKSLLNKKNSYSIAFGSPPPFRKGTLGYLDDNRLAGRFITIIEKGDVTPAIMKLLSIGKSSKDVDIYQSANPTLHKIITSTTFSVKFLCESVEPVGHYVVHDENGIYETTDMSKTSNLFEQVAVAESKSLSELDKVYFTPKE